MKKPIQREEQVQFMEIQDIRRQNLSRWVANNGTPQPERSYFSQLVSGTASFGERAARRLEHEYRMGDGYLDTRVATRMNAQQEEPGTPPAVVIPQFTGHGASVSLVLNDQPGQIHSWHVSPDWVAQNLKAHTGLHNLCIVTGFGDSMRPLYNPGDPLIMDKGVTSVDFDGLYFFRIGEEGFLKRLQRIPGKGLVAISQNKEYRDWVVKADMDFEVLGRIVKVWCGVDF